MAASFRNVVAAAAVVLQAVAQECTSAADCSLNGVCSDHNACVCDNPWAGSTCGILVFEDSQPGGIYGVSPNITSWGGSIVEDDKGGFHLYVAEIPGGLKNWGHDSKCVHATSKTIQGPFKRTDVVLDAECHNPSPIRDPKTGEYLLFHIGSGPKSGTVASGFLHHSSSPNGPWTPGRTSPGGCNNPAPAFHPNGTLFVVCSNMYLTSAYTKDSWNGEWSSKRGLNKKGGNPDRMWEDAHLWFDSRGNWHILYHIWTRRPWPTWYISGHAFSSDGLTWTFSEVEPYGGTVRFTDGTTKKFATMERPHLIFADKAHTTPVGIINGVSPQPAGPECNTCSAGWCSSCKQTAGRDYDYTTLRPLQGFKASRYASELVV